MGSAQEQQHSQPNLGLSSLHHPAATRSDNSVISNYRPQQRPSLRPNTRLAASPRRASAGNYLQAASLNQDEQLRRPSAPEPSAPRLSIADQFMSHNYPRVSATALATERIHGNSSNVVATSGSIHPKSPVERSSLSGPDPGRLTIAEMFSKASTLKATSSASFDSNNDFPLPRSPSQAHIVHPLEARSTVATNGAPADAFDSHLNLDLTLPVPKDTWDGRRHNRPFGSQETLVHSGGPGGNNNTVTSNSVQKMKADSDDYSMVDYYTDGSSSMTADDDERHQQKRYPWRIAGDINDGHDDDEEARLDGTRNNEAEPRGVWIGCCFMSCGQRHNHKPSKQNKSNQSKANPKQSSPTQQNQHKTRAYSRRAWVFCIFMSFILIVVTAYILWPRTPLMRIEGASLIAAPKVTETHQGVMVGNVAFESEWRVNVTVDNRGNKVPTHLTQIDVLAKDALTGLVIGKGGTQQQQQQMQQQPSSDGTQGGGGSEDVVLAPNAISTIQLPVWLDYQARDETDITFSSLRKACIPQPPTTHHDAKTNQTVTDQPQRESLQLHFWITLHIFGLDWLGYKPTVIVTPATGGFACPLS